MDPQPRTSILTVRAAYRHQREERLLRALVPLSLIVIPLFWTLEALPRSTLVPLGRDQGIFQYIGWALRQGEVDYRDIRDVNGPLTHWTHALLQVLGGVDTRIFHVLDRTFCALAFTLTGFWLAGACTRRRPQLIEHVLWGLAAFVGLTAQYLQYGYWDIAQRESFFNWLLLPAVAAQVVGQIPYDDDGAVKRSRTFLAVSTSLSCVCWFGKPTYVLFSALQAFVLLIDSDVPLSRKERLRTVALSAIITLTLGLVLVATTGDLRAYLRITLVDVPAMYRFLWPRTVGDIFSVPWYAEVAMMAVASSSCLLALIALGRLPRRLLVIALFPLLGLASVVAQKKAFVYHFHPVTAGIALQVLVLVQAAMSLIPVRRAFRSLRFVPVLFGLWWGIRQAERLAQSSHIKSTWLEGSAATRTQRGSVAYLRAFPEQDFFGADLKQAATFLKENTKRDARVQTYGMDPLVLFWAERLSATPYIYAYDLNVETAIAGGSGGVPTDAQAQVIRKMGEDHRTDLENRLRAKPPAAFVLMDQSPFFLHKDALIDLTQQMPSLGAWLANEYEEKGTFGTAHVWLKKTVM